MTLLIGATGYLGSAIARALISRGRVVHGLSRSDQNRRQLVEAGVTPVDGNLEDLAALTEIASRYEAVILAAFVPFDREFGVAEAIMNGCRVSGGRFIFTSGTGVLGVEAKDGRWSDFAFAENDPFPFPPSATRLLRLKTEDRVREASGGRFSTNVIRPPLIYGHGGSIQVPMIFHSVKKTGQACYVGKGLNLYSNAHVDDVADVYALALEKGTSGALYHAVAGEVNFRTIAEAVATVTGCDARSISFEQACEIWHPAAAEAGLAVNSRSVARVTRADLGWEPRHFDLIEDIRNGSYRDFMRRFADS